jgi:hypothetical protein
MPKQLLTGTLDEQCAFLYELAQDKMRVGNYTGAVHALKEIVKHNPGFRDAAQLLDEAKRRKSTHSTLLILAFLGAAVGVGAGTVLAVGNDLLFLGLALLGGVAGYGVGELWRMLRRN